MANVSTLGQFLDQISRLKSQQQTLGDIALQISSGKKTQTLSGLGAEITRTMRARADISSLETYKSNIDNAFRRMNLMQSSIKEVKSQAENILGSLTVAIQEGDYPDFESIKSLAGNVYDFILDAINQKDGDRFLFGGADFSEKPIDDTGLFESALGEFLPDSSDLTNPPLIASGSIGDWGDGTITTDQFIATYRATDETILGFSNPLTTNTAGKTIVRVDDDSEFDYTKLANKTAMKEIVRVLGVLKQLPPVEYAPGALNDPTATTIAGDTPPNPPAAKQESFFAVINDLRNLLSVSIDKLDQDSFDISQIQAQITFIKDGHSDQINVFKDIVADVEDADITEASTLLLQIQTQMQASFQVTAIVSQLSLVNFLNR